MLKQGNIEKNSEIVIEFDKATLKQAKKHFSLYGTILACKRITNLDRATISNAVKNGKATERVVNAITSYLNEITITANS